jgi:beta-carotene 3-hydroxylase
MPSPSLEEEAALAASRRVAERKARKQSERRTYLVAAVMSSLGVTSMAIASVYYRFAWQMEVRTCVATIRFRYLSSLPFGK